MLRKIAISAISALTLTTGAAFAAGGESHVHDTAFSFEGPFGTFDRNQLQRGLQVFTEVCSACHGMKFVPIRTLADEGGPELPADQVRAYAAGPFHSLRSLQRDPSGVARLGHVAGKEDDLWPCTTCA